MCELISNYFHSSFMYILSIALQLAGASVVLIMNVKRAYIIKSFKAKPTIILDTDAHKVSDLSPAIKERFKTSYTNIFAFAYLVGGYFLSIFGEKNASNLFIVTYVTIFTLILFGIYRVLIPLLLRQNKVTRKVTEEELKKLNVEPDMESISKQEVDDLFT